MYSREDIVEMINTNKNAFSDTFLDRKAIDEEILQAEERLGVKSVPEITSWIFQHDISKAIRQASYTGAFNNMKTPKMIYITTNFCISCSNFCISCKNFMFLGFT